MTNVRIEAGLLTASRDDRTVSGLLLPFGEVGRTGLGRFSVDPGIFTIPPDPMVVGLDVEHARELPVGRATSVSETDEGIVATFTIARTPEGDRALDEIESGERRSLSAEVADVVIRAGRAVSGRLFGAAVCRQGAFPSATLYASDVGDLPDEDSPAGQVGAEGAEPGEEATVPETAAEEATTETVTVDSTVVQTVDDGVTKETVTEVSHNEVTSETQPSGDAQNPDPAPAGEDTTTASPDAEDPEEEATVPETLTATVPAGSMAARSAKTKNPTELDLRGVATLLASAAHDRSSGLGTSTLLAALDQITAADVFSVVNPGQWLGQLWSGKTYRERFAPLIGHADLLGPKVYGWRFVTDKAPTVAAYNGFPNQPTSNEVDTEQVEETVSRIAGAWTVDRIHRDFPDAGWWAAFFQAATQDYARKRDAAVLANMVADATAVTAGAAVSEGVSEGAIKLVDGVLSMIDIATPTFAIMGTDLYRDYLLTKQSDALVNLTSNVGLDSALIANIVVEPSSSASLTNKVLVGAREAQTLHELPGVPIRVDAEAISTGGQDTGLFGYYAIITHDARGLALVADA